MWVWAWFELISKKDLDNQEKTTKYQNLPYKQGVTGSNPVVPTVLTEGFFWMRIQKRIQSRWVILYPFFHRESNLNPAYLPPFMVIMNHTQLHYHVLSNGVFFPVCSDFFSFDKIIKWSKILIFNESILIGSYRTPVARGSMLLFNTATGLKHFQYCSI